MTGKIFINYRRDDSIGTAGRLHDRLAQAFGRDNLFMDVDHIPAGVDFVAHLNSQVAECGVVLVVIGPNWLRVKDKAGQRRLHQPDDFVAIEIAAALGRDIRVIPILVDGARMPKADKLPDAIKPLVRRNAVEIRNAQFGRDAEALIERLREALGQETLAAKAREALGQETLVARAREPLGQETLVARSHEAPKGGTVGRRFELHLELGQRRRTVVAAAAVVVVLVAGGLYWIGVNDPRPNPVLPPVDTTVTAPALKVDEVALKAGQERRAKAAAEAESKRLEEERRRAAEAEAKRKADEAERQRLAARKAEENSRNAEAETRARFSDEIAASAPTVRWRLQNTFPTATPTTLPLFARRVGELSGGRMSVDLLPAGAVVPAFQIASAVSGGALDFGYGLGSYFYGKDKAFALMSAVPFGFEPREHLAFRRRADVAAIFDRLLAKEGIVALPCGSFGRNGDLWLKKPLSATAGLAGAKLRFVALPSEIFKNIGSAVVVLPGGEIVPAMDRGIIDGGQFVDPKSDLDLGLPDVAKYYYYPGSINPGYVVDLFVAKSKWDMLPGAGRQIVEQACREAVDAMLDEYDHLGKAALADIARRGVTVAPLPAAVQRDLYTASREVLTKLAGENEAVRSLMAIVDQMRPSTIGGKMR